MSTKEFTYEEVAEHNTKKDIYVVIHDKVYNCTDYVDEHPGGDDIILELAGQDVSESFDDAGHSDLAQEALAEIFVGNLVKEKPKAAAASKESSPAHTAKLRVSSAAVLVVSSIVALFAFQFSQGSLSMLRSS